MTKRQTSSSSDDPPEKRQKNDQAAASSTVAADRDPLEPESSRKDHSPATELASDVVTTGSQTKHEDFKNPTCDASAALPEETISLSNRKQPETAPVFKDQSATDVPIPANTSQGANATSLNAQDAAVIPATKTGKASTRSQGTKKAPAKLSSKAKGKRKMLDDPPVPKPKRINKVVKTKVTQVLDFLNNGDGPILARWSDEKDHVTVTYSAMIAALMTIRSDFEISDPRRASLLDVTEAIVRRFEHPVGTYQIEVEHVTFDTSVSLPFVEEIQMKIAGHGLDGVNLVEIELEMYTRKLEAMAAENLFRAVEELEGEEIPDDDELDAVTDAVTTGEVTAQPEDAQLQQQDVIASIEDL